MLPMSDLYYVFSETDHNALVAAVYQKRGYTQEEAEAAATFAAYAAKHGIRTHNALKALHLDEDFGSAAGGCVPGAEMEKKAHRFEAAEVWNANRKLGQAVGYEAIERGMELADRYGVGMISVDHAFHYLWGGGYVMHAAKKGYIAYTNCTSALTEVVPFQGKYPTLGTNPHSWGFPTVDAIGFPIVIDWATSVVAMGRVQQFLREGRSLPPHAAVDEAGNPTSDPNKVFALLPFGAHKGYGLSLINELVSALIGSSLPTLRCRKEQLQESGREGEKITPSFYFQVIHPEAMSGGQFAQGRTQAENLKAVLNDILGHGNESCLLPGQMEAEAAAQSEKAGGLLFTEAEIGAFNALAEEVGMARIDAASLKTYFL